MPLPVAGFVEPGESLEEAVAREIAEEVGVQVTDIRYFGSQPWPFPHSIMIGFFARYAGGEITIDPNEIEKAGSTLRGGGGSGEIVQQRASRLGVRGACVHAAGENGDLLDLRGAVSSGLPLGLVRILEVRNGILEIGVRFDLISGISVDERLLVVEYLLVDLLEL